MQLGKTIMPGSNHLACQTCVDLYKANDWEGISSHLRIMRERRQSRLSGGKDFDPTEKTPTKAD